MTRRAPHIETVLHRCCRSLPAVAAAAVVRPDWYLFGAVADGGELADLLGEIDRALGVPVPD
jgi:hypothetical protein